MTIKLDPGQHADAHVTPAADLLSRRVILRRMGAALIAAPLLPLLSCSTDTVSNADAAGTGADATTTDSAAGDISSVAWATGGTAAMRDKASYPNPFATGSTSACALTCAMVLGPCYSAQSETIQDISYGYDGLPTRMYLQILDESCKPVPGAVVDVWHVSAAGKYSGNDSVNENVAFCTGNDGDFTSHLYFRGKQATDGKGVVFFDTCFPGWYAGRTIHIHMTVNVGDQAFVTTQLFFADTLADEIIGGQPLYDTRGARDTTNQNDSVIASSAVGDYLFETAKMTDGAMLAWKTLLLRTSLSEALCDAPGGIMGGGGPGGPGGNDAGPPGGGPSVGGGDGGGPPPRG